MRFLRNLRLDTVDEWVQSGLCVAQAALDRKLWQEGRFARYDRAGSADLPSSNIPRPLCFIERLTHWVPGAAARSG